MKNVLDSLMIFLVINGTVRWVLYDVVLFGKGKIYCVYYQDLYKGEIKNNKVWKHTLFYF